MYRKNYWLELNENQKPKSIISDFCGTTSKRHKDDILLGAWYDHEKTPYIEKGKVLRDRYNEKIEIY